MKRTITSFILIAITISIGLAQEKQTRESTNGKGGITNKPDPCPGGATRYFYDNDGDNAGDSNITQCFCEPGDNECIGNTLPSGNHNWVTQGGDCDDDDPTVKRFATWYYDGDNDGDGNNNMPGIYSCGEPSGGNYVRNNDDCDDSDPNIGASNIVYYSDIDGDGLGDPNGAIYGECSQPAGYVTNSDDNCPSESGPYDGCPYEALNWITSRTLDASGNETSNSKVYYDELGRPTQSQSVNIRTGDTWVSQTMYDSQGRAALQTLSAPVGMPTNYTFEFKDNFIRKGNGQGFTANDFENNPEAPQPVGTQPNSLGWYYSSSNTDEPFQDITNYPYARTIFSELNPGSALKTLGGNKVDVDDNGTDEWANGFSYTVPASQELFYAFGKGYFGQEGVVESSEEVITKYLKTVSVDVHGVETVAFTDMEGKLLATARSGGDDKYYVISTIGEQGYVDIHIPEGVISSDISFLSSQSQYEVYDLRTEQLVSTSNLTGGHFYRIIYTSTGQINTDPVIITGGGSIQAPNLAKGISYKVNYYDYALNYYDKAGRLIESTQPLGFDTNAFDLTAENPDHRLKSTYTYNAAGELLSTTSPDEGTAEFIYREDGQIRFSQNSKQAVNEEFSYTNYDDRGRPIESGVYRGSLSFSDAQALGFTMIDGYLIGQSGNRVVKKAEDSWLTSALATTKMVTGNGFIKWRFPVMGQNVMVGLSPTNINNAYNTINYAIYTYDNKIWIYESGTNRGSFGIYSTSDVFKVERVGSTIYYKKNNSTFYTSNITTSANLLGDMALYSSDSRIADFEMGGNTILPFGTPNYKHITNVSISGNVVTKNTIGTNWDAALKTADVIQGDGSFSFSPSQTNKAMMAGLTSRIGLSTTSFTFLDYGIYFTTSGTAIIYENGYNVAWLNGHTSNDVFTVERVGNLIQYLKNGSIVYTSEVSSNKDLAGMVCIKDQGAAIDGLTMQNAAHVFKDYHNAETSGSNIRKISPYAWNGGFASQESFNGEGYVSFKAPNLIDNHTLMLGLSYSNQNNSFNTIDFAIYLHRNGLVYVYEGGSSKGLQGSYEPGDEFRIQRTQALDEIRYYKNDVLLYTSFDNDLGSLRIDASFHDPDAYVQDLGLFVPNNPSQVVELTDNLDPNNCKERTLTVYDVPEYSYLNLLTQAGISANHYPRQNFVSGNVSKTYTLNPTTASTWYSYDIYGRVEWMVQHINGLGIKTIDYEYDYATGAVYKVDYQRHVPSERFVHRYEYGTAGELTNVATSTNGSTFTNQADYNYYEDGALKRKFITPISQGTDYVYNLSGQLKAINHPSLSSANDPGGDSNDLFGMHIDYYDGDYTRTNTPKPIVTTGAGQNRFDGNIKATRWANRHFEGGNPSNHEAYVYNYDKNKWLTGAQYGTAYNNGNISLNNNYRVSGLEYDPNGNLLSLERKNATGGNMDNFTYNYNTQTNKLDHVNDPVAASSLEDLDGQASGNYEYNSTGQLIRNNSEDLVYTYNASGLVTSVKKENGVMSVEFVYNDRGHRILKEFTPDGQTYYNTFYARDASGSPMAVYSGSYGSISQPIALEENTIFGASRLGVYKRQSQRSHYQVTDHLGNVRAVISNTTITNATDYYPFGMPMPNRNVEGNYRYKFQGQEKDPETGMEAFELRLWDSRIGRWLTTDPAGQFHSPYLGMGNNPINGLDPDGARWYKNSATGEVKYFEMDGLAFSDLDGNEWTITDYGTELLEFDGNNLTYSFEEGNPLTGFKLTQYTYNADSGRPLSTIDLGHRELNLFDYSEERQIIENVGPIPEGNYFLLKDKVQSWDDLSITQKAKAFVGRGQWPGGESAWGSFRYEIYPKSVDLGNGITRGNFFVHGGYYPGSAGCIDLCSGIRAFNKYFTHGSQNKVHLIVHYD